MKEEFRKIKNLGKEIVGKESFKKIKLIKDTKERTESLKYLINSKLRLLLDGLKDHLKKVDRKESLILESKIILLESKIKVFSSTYSKRDYLVVQKLIREIEEEIEEVTGNV